MFRVFARNESGGISVILKTAEAALRKVQEFREAGFQFVSVLDAMGATIEEVTLAAMAKAEGRNAAT
jgi:hypothetical protein